MAQCHVKWRKDKGIGSAARDALSKNSNTGLLAEVARVLVIVG